MYDGDCMNELQKCFFNMPDFHEE